MLKVNIVRHEGDKYCQIFEADTGRLLKGITKYRIEEGVDQPLLLYFEGVAMIEAIDVPARESRADADSSK